MIHAIAIQQARDWLHAMRFRPRHAGMPEILGRMVERKLSLAAISRPEFMERIREWQRMPLDMEAIILVLAHAKSPAPRSAGTPASHPGERVRTLCSRYVSLQLAAPDIPAEGILRRMLEQTDG